MPALHTFEATSDGKKLITPKKIAKDTCSAVEKDGEVYNRK